MQATQKLPSSFETPAHAPDLIFTNQTSDSLEAEKEGSISAGVENVTLSLQFLLQEICQKYLYFQSLPFSNCQKSKEFVLICFQYGQKELFFFQTVNNKYAEGIELV